MCWILLLTTQELCISAHPAAREIKVSPLISEEPSPTRQYNLKSCSYQMQTEIKLVSFSPLQQTQGKSKILRSVSTFNPTGQCTSRGVVPNTLPAPSASWNFWFGWDPQAEWGQLRKPVRWCLPKQSGHQFCVIPPSKELSQSLALSRGSHHSVGQGCCTVSFSSSALLSTGTSWPSSPSLHWQQHLEKKQQQSWKGAAETSSSFHGKSCQLPWIVSEFDSAPVHIINNALESLTMRDCFRGVNSLFSISGVCSNYTSGGHERGGRNRQLALYLLEGCFSLCLNPSLDRKQTN